MSRTSCRGKVVGLVHSRIFHNGFSSVEPQGHWEVMVVFPQTRRAFYLGMEDGRFSALRFLSQLVGNCNIIIALGAYCGWYCVSISCYSFVFPRVHSYS